MIPELQEREEPLPQQIVPAHMVVAPSERRLRIVEVILVLSVAFSPSIAGSIFVAITGASIAGHYDANRLAMGICSEVSALGLLAYVLYRHSRSWSDLTKMPGWKDIPRGIGVFVASSVLYALVYYAIQFTSFGLTHQWIRPKSLSQLLAVGISALSLAFVFVNPFFEELIVRAYLMSEIRAVGGTRAAAVLISVSVQVSYHLYQGWFNALLVGSLFSVFSIYYLKTRRIGPIIFAHMLADVSALLRHHA